MTIPRGILLAVSLVASLATSTGAETPVPADTPVSLEALLRRTGARVTNDTAFGRLVLERDGRRATISPGVAFLLLGERSIPVRHAPRQEGRQVWVPEESVRLLEDFFRDTAPPRVPERNATPAGRVTPVPVPPRPPVVVLDPGHGGRDPGTNRAGVREKDIVLAVARAVAGELESSGVKVVLTRQGDQSLGASQDASLAARVDIGSEVLPDAFVSLHVDATAEETTSARGFTVYVPPHVFRERRLGSREFDPYRRAEYTAGRQAFRGRAIGRDGEVRGTVAAALFGLLFEENVRSSQRLGRAIEAELGGIRGMLTRGVKANDLFVLKWGWSPSVLVEMGYINNPEERRMLQSASHRADLARAVARGILRFLRESGRIEA